MNYLKSIITITFFLTNLLSQNSIEGRWHLVGYEDNIMYQFDNNYRYSIYSIDGNFGSIEEAGGSPNPYFIENNIITIDNFFGNVVSYQMDFYCDGQVVDFINTEYATIHSTLFREDYNYINNLCTENDDLNQDGSLDVLDIVLLVSYILNDSANENGDINDDGFLNVLDIVLLVDKILNQETIPESGLFINQQYQDEELTFIYDIVYSKRSNMNGLQYSSNQNQVQDQLLDTILLELDIAIPPNPENKLLPLVILIHGGGFSGGSKESRLQDTKDYAKLGYIGCTINYRLTPYSYQIESGQNQLQAVFHAVEDAMNAIRFLKSQDYIYNIDTNRVVTIGTSAGGFISLINAIENDITSDLGMVSDYIYFSSKVSAAISTGAAFEIEPFNFDEDDASCLIMHSEDYDPVTGLTWEGDVIPLYEAIINSGNHAALVSQPSNSHVVPVGPFGAYSDDIIPFIWEQLNLNNW
ncbi:MAG: hypothetical protein CMF96_02120 [Candidatus Marinimicrobia bacterium]|nr:hypothetical protein [Candidatus Neomarinimicrobiota bacterium]